MSSKIENIIRKYPNLYKDGEIRGGFHIDDGWLNLVEILSSILEHEIKGMPEEIRGQFYCVQVKEKFGTLRIYLSNTTPFLDGAISVAESFSKHICEKCGRPGQLKNKSWMQTLCDDCDSK